MSRDESITLLVNWTVGHVTVCVCVIILDSVLALFRTLNTTNLFLLVFFSFEFLENKKKMKKIISYRKKFSDFWLIRVIEPTEIHLVQ